ncbi:MAG: type II and III secretion system protein, partial [Armatimonadetes bacterium]|nr:type II and III secretion system protein [Armatimonadota bacterium]
MNLHPEVSVIVDWKELRDVSLALPQISRRFVDSTVRVKDGETIVIGGLIKDEEIKNMSGIPFLKDLPILGSLFRYDSKSKTHSEVMMFITPKIVQAHQ